MVEEKERTPAEMKEIAAFEKQVIAMAQIMYPGRSCFSSEVLNKIRENLRSAKQTMETPQTADGKFVQPEVRETGAPVLVPTQKKRGPKPKRK